MLHVKRMLEPLVGPFSTIKRNRLYRSGNCSGLSSLALAVAPNAGAARLPLHTLREARQLACQTAGAAHEIILERRQLFGRPQTGIAQCA